MNFKQMREYVANILDYNPQVEAYKKEVNDILNQVYVTHFTSRPWEYAQREYDIEIYGDQNFNGEIWTKGVFVSPNEGSPVYGPNMVFEATSNVDGIQANKEYNVLSRFDDGTESYLVLQDPVYQLDQYPINDCLVSNGTTGEISFKLKHRHVILPSDCVEVLSIGLRGRQTGFRQPFFNLAKYEDEKLGLDLDQEGIPTNWVETMPISLPSPRVKPNLVIGAGTNVTATAGTYQCAYTFTILSSTTRGLTELESAPIFGDEQVFAAGVSLDVENIEITDTFTGGIPQTVFRGLRKNVYVKTPDTNHFVRVSNITVAEQQSDTTTVLGNGIDFSQPLIFETLPKLQENQGTYKTFRLYPRQQEDYSVKLRYHFRPKELQDDQDCPVMPTDSHLFLCYSAISELFFKHSNTTQASVYQQKAARELLKIENKYLTQKDKAHIKNSYRASDSFYGRPFIRITRVP